MRHTKNPTTPRVRKPKAIQELQPNKICKCGACEPSLPKPPEGTRRLKVGNQLIIHHRAPVKEESIYDYVPQIKLQGEWLRKIGFERGKNVLVKTKKGKLIIEIERE